MPNIKSSKKDVKRSRLLHERNVSYKSKMKTFIKKAKMAAEAGDEAAEKDVSAAVSVIDKVAQKGIIHKNAAARRKSRLMRAANKAKAAAE